MSRIANLPIAIPKGVDVNISGQQLSVKGTKGTMSLAIHHLIQVDKDGEQIKVKQKKQSKLCNAIAGTTRALINNLVTGVSKGFERKLTLVGVGYRAQAQGSKLNLSLGFSHPVLYTVPAGITVETPQPTDIIIKGIDKQKVGQVAAEIRSIRPPECYKGKGVRYSDEVVIIKETEKKK